MGELPGESDNNISSNGTHGTNYAPNSEDSDMEDANIFEGYEPLPTEDFGSSVNNNDENLPGEILSNTISGDMEIAQQVWNETRPTQEIELDTSKTQEIMSAMACITLPPTAIPDWAQVVPEEKWKQDLLDRIRQRKESSFIENKKN